MRSASSSIVPAEGAAGPRQEGPAAGEPGVGATREGNAPGAKHLRMLSASAKQIGMRQGASLRVKQSKSRQIVANADPHAPTRVAMSMRGQFEWTGRGLKLAAPHLEHQHGPTGVAHEVKRPPATPGLL
jgi:hypothetical protein